MRINSNDYEYRVEISKPSKNEAGLYKCQIANDHGQMQVYLHLNIEGMTDSAKRMTKDAPTFIDTPKIVSLNNGQLVNMIARYQAKEQYYCSWSKKGTSLSESEKVQIYHGKVDNNTYEYRVELREPTENASGLYKCLIGNDHGQNQVYLTMDIKGK